MITITQIGWFGVAVAMFATPAAELLGIPRVSLIVIVDSAKESSANFKLLITGLLDQLAEK